MELVQIDRDKARICRSVLEELPAWFGIDEARERYIAEAEEQMMLACLVDGQEIGMLTLKIHGRWNMEITVMGVLPEFHRQGAGRQLVRRAAQTARDHGCRMLTVKTISERNADPNYRQTRAFYQAVGFELFEEFPTLWGEANPCALFVLPIAADHG